MSTPKHIPTQPANQPKQGGFFGFFKNIFRRKKQYDWLELSQRDHAANPKNAMPLED